MVENLAIGALMIAVTVLVHTTGLMMLSKTMQHIVRWFRLHRHGVGKTVAMTATVIGLFFVHTVEIWSWALLFYALDAVRGFDNALYFSTVTFSTVGYGDIIPDPEWRLLASLEGINGFILISWSTAFLVMASTRFGPFRSGEHF